MESISIAQLHGMDLQKVKMLLGRWLQADHARANEGCVLCFSTTGRQVSLANMSELGRKEYALSGVCEHCYGMLPQMTARIPTQVKNFAAHCNQADLADIITLDMAVYLWVMICKTRHALLWDRCIIDVLKALSNTLDSPAWSKTRSASFLHKMD